MKFRNARVQRIWYGWIAAGIAVGCGVLAYGIARGGHPSFVLFLTILGGGLVQSLGFRGHLRAVHRRAGVKLREAFEIEDARRAREAIETLRGISAASGAAALLLYEAGVFAMEERWPEALEKLDAVDLAVPDELHRIVSSNARAWYYAMSGRGGEAVELATKNLEAARAAKVDDLAPYVGTLGAAQHAAGDHETATKTLQAAIDMGGGPRMIAIRAYHLGEAARACGRTEQARAAYRRASDAQPRGPWGDRARARLHAMGDRPYRE